MIDVEKIKKYWVPIALVTYVVFVIVYSILFFFSYGKNYLLSSNELGDFLAGFFAPIAFLFIVLGYLQQRNAIAENTRILGEQIEELQLSKQLMKKTNQPKFVINIRNVSFDEKNSLLKFYLDILNTHQECTLLSYEFLDEDFNKAVNITGSFPHKLDTNKNTEFHVTIYNPSNSHKPRQLFKIFYLDIFGNKNEFFFLLKIDLLDLNQNQVDIAPESLISKYQNSINSTQHH